MGRFLATEMNKRFIVVYKDHATARNNYYGPFVSDAIADDFMRQLPEPLKGGAKVVKPLHTFTHYECDMAALEIIERRKQDQTVHHLVSNITDKCARLGRRV